VKGERQIKIFDAMLFKREIGTNCSIDVKMLDTLKDGIVLSIEQDAVNCNDLAFIKNFIIQHKLNLLLESERYFISTNALIASSPWEN
jgi:hypothetical protein